MVLDLNEKYSGKARFIVITTILMHELHGTMLLTK